MNISLIELLKCNFVYINIYINCVALRGNFI